MLAKLNEAGPCWGMLFSMPQETCSSILKGSLNCAIYQNATHQKIKNQTMNANVITCQEQPVSQHRAQGTLRSEWLHVGACLRVRHRRIQAIQVSEASWLRLFMFFLVSACFIKCRCDFAVALIAPGSMDRENTVLDGFWGQLHAIHCTDGNCSVGCLGVLLHLQFSLSISQFAKMQSMSDCQTTPNSKVWGDLNDKFWEVRKK